MPENFNSNYSRYYDLLYKNKDYKSEAEYIAKLIRSVHPQTKNILELGAGTGNHAAILCNDGFTVTGLERSAEMVAKAKEKKIEGFTPVVGDIQDYSIDQKFDAVISLFHVISYLTSNTALIDCFNTTNSHLNKGGVFIFDVWYTPAVYVQGSETRIKKMEDDDIEITRLAQPEAHYNLNVIDVNYEIIIQDKKTRLAEQYPEKHPMRHFSIPEINLLALLTGFEVIKTEEFLTAANPGENTWGVCFVLQKK
ncbi:class I SAM-dependent methyltransferase [Ferruginibacter albus]|uniref:class I SAM-dependent methyltransferase n=1 Tax=Ferruginibacter albus TaxID=2875540 RepID=UPI001CC46894|nr:class I SAM-dependent methyltransferase [Ferruginibacter albus]UAY50695.1 methyltransferase domain-containing protein [Ferruginibacter albus]